MPEPRARLVKLSGVSRRAACLAALGTSLGLRAALPVPGEVAAELPGMRLLGSGRLTFFAMHIYDARLWVGAAFQPEAFSMFPLALELEYARNLKGELIAERSLKEMLRGADMASERAQAWLAQMNKLFPDVTKNDRLTAAHRPGQALRFFLNGQLRGEVSDPAFAPAFLGIWLAPHTSEPKLRRALLAENGPAS